MAKKKKLLTPQQEKFLALLTNPQSKTFGDYYNSAKEAEYEESYAKCITSLMPKWLYENICDTKLLNKAVKNLDKSMDYDPVNEDGKIDTSLLGIQSTNARFIAETVGKKRFSKRSGLLDDQGNVIPQPIYVGIAIKTIQVSGHDGDAQSLPAPKED